MKEENYRLINLAQNGDEKAFENLLSMHRGLIWSSVRKFLNRGAEQDDLYQIGAIGLIKAVNNFDKTFNVEFSTYAIPMIMGEIKRFLRDDGIIKVSRNLKEIAFKAKAASEKVLVAQGRDAGIREIAEMINVPASEIVLSLEAIQPTESIYKSVFDGNNNSILLLDKLYNNDNDEERTLTLITLKDAIKKLPYKEKQILMLRYYKEKTQSEVARIMGVSQVQISRIEKKVLGTLREKIS